MDEATGGPLFRIVTPLSSTAAGSQTARPTQSSQSSYQAPGRKSKRAKTVTAATAVSNRSADLFHRFSRQTTRAHAWAANNSGQKSAKPVSFSNDPILDDMEEGDNDFANLKGCSFSNVNSQAKKRFIDNDNTSCAAKAGLLNASYRFLQLPRQPPRPESLDDDLRPWSERFGPANLDELAVHKKKVLDVRRWLEGVLRGRLGQRLLVLKGAAGSGKTTTLRLLARDLGCELLEWRTPSLSSTLGTSSMSARFDHFVGLGGRFSTLDTTLPAPISAAQAALSVKSHQVIVLEEFPNTFTRSSAALASFRSTVLRFLQGFTPAPPPNFGQQKADRADAPALIIPIILVVSETLLATTAGSADSLTVHRLLGHDILQHAGTGIIEFNAIAPSLLAKALELVVRKEARISGRRRTPGPLLLKQLGEIGDIRNAVASLEFLCLKGDMEANWGANVSFTKPKRGSTTSGSAPLTKAEQDSLALVCQRKASLGVFHAVGKVIYNKREEAVLASDLAEAPLPDHLRHQARPRHSQIAVDRLIDEIGTDPHTFISALHENYVLSCEAANMLRTLDHVNDCLGYLSDCDMLSRRWDVFFGGRGSAAGSFGSHDVGAHMCRQDELVFHTAVRGLLHSLPWPVKRTAVAAVPRATAFKMSFPASIKLWRARRELESLADAWAAKLLLGRCGDDAAGADEAAVLFARHPPPPADRPLPAPLPLGAITRSELLLDRLPYMALLCRAGRRRGNLDRLVAFSSTGPPADDVDDNESDDYHGCDGAWASEEPAKLAAPLFCVRAAAALPPAVQELVLTDDDIEDD